MVVFGQFSSLGIVRRIVDGGFGSHNSSGCAQVVFSVFNENNRLFLDKKVIDPFVGDLLTTITTTTDLTDGRGDGRNFHMEAIIHLEVFIAV